MGHCGKQDIGLESPLGLIQQGLSYIVTLAVAKEVVQWGKVFSPKPLVSTSIHHKFFKFRNHSQEFKWHFKSVRLKPATPQKHHAPPGSFMRVGGGASPKEGQRDHTHGRNYTQTAPYWQIDFFQILLACFKSHALGITLKLLKWRRRGQKTHIKTLLTPPHREKARVFRVPWRLPPN